MKKPTAELRNWRVVPLSSGVIYIGEIWKDEQKRFENGTQIQTSPILNTKQNDNGVTKVETANTKYTLVGEEANHAF